MPKSRELNVTTPLAIVLIVAIVVLVAPYIFVPRSHLPEKTATLSNLKQLAVASLEYASDHDDCLPLADNWMDEIGRYTHNKECLVDPTIEDRKESNFGYAFFEPLNGVSVERIEDPASMPLHFQSSDLSRNAHGFLDLLPGRTKPGGNVVSFADGHVKYKGPEWRFEVITIDLRESAASQTPPP